MSKNLIHKQHNQLQRRKRIRSKITGTNDRPRLNIKVSNSHITAQLIDDSTSHTLVYVSTIGQKKLSGSLTNKAEWVGETIAKNAKVHKISKVVFDRGSKLYHGRIAALAEAARKNGLEF